MCLLFVSLFLGGHPAVGITFSWVASDGGKSHPPSFGADFATSFLVDWATCQLPKMIPSA